MILLVDTNRKYRRYRPNPSEKVQLANNGLQWVLSSNVSALGINDDDLIIRFHNGSLYQYEGQAKHFKPMLSSNSKGSYVWIHLRRKKVPYKKIGALPLNEDVETSDDDIFNLIDMEGLAFLTKLQAMGMFIPNATSGLDLIGIEALLR
jgi:hypothetical protein